MVKGVHMGSRKKKIELLEQYFVQELAEDKRGPGSDFDKEVLKKLSCLKELFKDDPYEQDIVLDIQRAENEGL